MSEKFHTVAVFQYSTEAQVIKGRLEADGIEVFMSDNFLIDTDPLVSNAIGGVKLKVRGKDVIQAKRIIDTINTYSVDEEGEAIECENCGESKVRMYSTVTDLKSFFSFVIGLMVGTLPFSARYKYRCENCNHEFDIK